MRRVRGWAVSFALCVLWACGGPPSPANDGTTRQVSSKNAGAPVAHDEAGSTFPTLDMIAARGAVVSPGMREIARHDGGTEASDIARADAGDLCVRLLFVATEPVGAELLDGTGAVLAKTEEGEGSATLAEGGPVCVRRGGAVRVRFHGPATARVRWVAWGAR